MKRTVIIASCLLAVAWAFPAWAESKLDQQVQALQAQIDALTTQANNQQGQVNTLTGQVNGQQGQINTLTGQVNSQQAQVNTLQTQLAAQEASSMWRSAKKRLISRGVEPEFQVLRRT